MDIVVQITMKYQVWFAKLVVGDVDEMVDLQPDEALVVLVEHREVLPLKGLHQRQESLVMHHHDHYDDDSDHG